MGPLSSNYHFRSAAAAAPGDLLEMQILQPLHGLTQKSVLQHAFQVM